jgi:hypothetical protein
MHIALAARPGVAWTFAGADHVELFVVWREDEAIRVGKLVLRDDDIKPPAGINFSHPAP